jgi:tetratricopeptide (TPR) repeat protein
MKMKSIYLSLAMMVALSALLLGQTSLIRVSGVVTDGTTPIADAQVTFTNAATGRSHKTKTGKDGTYAMVGLEYAVYTVEVASSKGEKLCTQKRTLSADSGQEAINIDINEGSAKKVTAEEIEKIKAQNAKATSINALIKDYQTAANAQNWPEAESNLKKMVEMEPTRWEYYQALGNVQLNQKEYDDAANSLSKGIELAQGVASSSAPKSTPAPGQDPAKAKVGVGQMLAAQGNVYIKLNKIDLAIASFTKAAEMDPNPAVAYFNLCATQYNIGKMKEAAVSCDKAIAADPKKADAYFIKGSAMYGDGKLDANNKYVVPPGTTEALNKYLELAPEGGHAADVKAMLEALGVKIETTFKSRKK